MSLVARELESHGIATVIVGSAQDIVEVAGVPRLVFVDYPLGNPLGKPGNKDEQIQTVRAALDMIELAFAPRTTRRLDLEWGTEEWRDTFMHVGPDNAAELAEAGRRRREKQAANKQS